MKTIFLAFAQPDKVTGTPMSPARKAKFDSITNTALKGQYLASSAAIARALYEVTGINDSYMTFRYDASGAPVVSGAYVSPAHTDGLAVCAAAEIPVGVDMEKRDRKISRALADRIGGLDDWLALEACVKLTGEGLASGLGRYRLNNGGIVDENGDYAAHAYFMDYGEYRLCVCCREESEIRII